MRKLTFAVALMASLGAGALATSAQAAPGAPMGVTAPATVTDVAMTRMERRMMKRRMMRNNMERRMMKRRMMRDRMNRRMMRRM